MQTSKPELDGIRSAGAPGPGFAASRGRLLGALLPLVLFGALILLDVPLCPSRTLLGIPCPGCGLTRATFAMLHLDLATMWQFHPLAPLLAPLYVYALVRAGLVHAGVVSSARRDLLARAPKWVWPAALVVLLGVWIGRLALGVHPDHLDPANGLVGRAIRFVAGAG